jgi:hypothetical protein
MTLPLGEKKEDLMGFIEGLGQILTVMAEAGMEMNEDLFTEEEKMEIANVRNLLAKKNKTEAVAELDKVMASWNYYSKPSTSLTTRSTSTDTVWEQKRKIEQKIQKKMSSADRIEGLYVSLTTTSDSVIVYLNASFLNIRYMTNTDLKGGAAIIIRNYHVQNVIKGYSRLYADTFEKAINKIADSI